MYYNKYRKLIDKFAKNNFYSEEERAKAISQLSKKEQEIIDTYDKYLQDYLNAKFEVDARQKGEEYGKRYRQKSRHPLSRTFGTQRTGIRPTEKGDMGPNARNDSTGRSRPGTNRGRLGKLEERHRKDKETFSKLRQVYKSKELDPEKIQQTTKNHILKWYSGIEKDRYDINKNLTSFINITKRYAKDLSKKLYTSRYCH